MAIKGERIAFYFQLVETPVPKSPSPTREVPSSTFVETPPNQQPQQQKPQRPQQPPMAAVQSPEDNRVSSMSDETAVTEQEPPAVQEFAGMLRFGNRLLLLSVKFQSCLATFVLLVEFVLSLSLI